jgi:hypothetical protein
MGFNYLQTDDRDDYFSQMEKKKSFKFKFALYSDSQKLVLAHNKEEAAGLLKTGIGMIGMVGNDGKFIPINKPKKRKRCECGKVLDANNNQEIESGMCERCLGDV